MALSLSLDLDFMLKNVEGMADDQRMVQEESSPGITNFNIVAGKKDSGIVSRGSSGQAIQNNLIRQHLVDALKVQFHVDSIIYLPKCVRDALNVGFWKDDMKIDENGKVTSGRPLTARRIRAVISAAQEALDYKNGLELAILDAKDGHEDYDHEVFDFFKVEQEKYVTAPVLTTFDDGIDQEVMLSFAKGLFTIESQIHAKMTQAMKDEVDGGDGLKWRSVFVDMILGRMSKVSRKYLLSYVQSDECRQLLKSIYDQLDVLPDEESVRLSGASSTIEILRLAIANFYGIDLQDMSN